MKKIYELIYVTNDGHEHNVLYANVEKAYRHREIYYQEGSIVDESIVVRSFVISRILF